jgi:hypothetical protein
LKPENLKGKDVPNLAEVLDLDLFGRGEAKTFRELETEIASGESQILWENDRPVRVVQIVCIQVLSPHCETLMEDRQEFADGRVRRRGLEGVSEKLHPGETPLNGVQRALAEELGILSSLTIEPLDQTVEQKESPSYPGLQSRYHKYRFRVVLPPSLYQSLYIEEQISKKTFFAWIPYAG